MRITCCKNRCYWAVPVVALVFWAGHADAAKTAQGNDQSQQQPDREGPGGMDRQGPDGTDRQGPGGMDRQGGMNRRGGGMGQRGPMSADERLARMTKELKLTTDQQAKIKPIMEDEQKKMMALREDASGDRQAMRAKMQEIMADGVERMRAVLDEKQKQKFDKDLKERRERMQERRGGRGFGGPGGPGGDENPGPPQN